MKKQLSAVLSAALLVTSFSFSANAADVAVTTAAPTAPVTTIGVTSAQTQQPTTAELEALIKLVKPKFDVPENFKVFTWNYNGGSYENAPVWSLNWETADNTGNISVSADNTGHIQSYSKYIQKSNYKNVLPTYLKEELTANAKAFLEKIAPDEAKSMQFTEATTYGIYSNGYNYHFTRYENNIPFPSNNAYVTVDNSTGEVTSFNMQFDYNLEVPAPGETIAPEKAKELLKSGQSMELSYRVKYDYTADNENKTKTVKAYLVYTPKLPYISVNAKTGEIYTETTQWKTVSKEDSMKSASPARASGMAKDEDSYQLTEEETAQLDVLEKLITREDAIKAVTGNAALYINPALTTIDATLQKAPNYRNAYYYGENYDCDYIWQIDFSNPRPDDNAKYDYSYAYAVVNAETGKLISFNANLHENEFYLSNNIEAPKVVFNEDQAKAILEGFFKEQVPEKFASVKYTDSNPVNVLKYVSQNDVQVPVYGAYRYNYVRVNEGINFDSNALYGSVDGVTGKIVSYGYRWNSNIEFESPKDAISQDKAYELFMNLDGFGLNYEINRNYTYKEYLLNGVKPTEFIDTNKLYEYKPEVRLVYSTYNTYPQILSAITGKQVDYSGEIYIQQVGDKGYTYNDIAGHWAEKTIRLFGDVNVGFAGGSFKPDALITEEEFKSLLNTSGYYSNTDGKAIKATEATAPFTRVEAVKLIIKSLGFSEIAEIKDIYKTDFADNSGIKDNDIGYVAIARGLKIIQGSDGTFRPYDTLTRAEALTLLKNTLMR